VVYIQTHGEQHLQIRVEEQHVKQIFIKASDLLFMALYPIDLEKTIESYQTDCYIVKEFTPIIFHNDDGMGDKKFIQLMIQTVKLMQKSV
jgi:hypothetical protein